MRVESVGAGPTWVAGLTDAALLDRFGAGAFQRGRAYARGRAVQTLQLTERVIDAWVSGGQPEPYDVWIVAGGTTFDGGCSCPVGGDCKHVVAVLLTTRSWLEQQRGAVARQTADWEDRLAGLLIPEPDRPPLGLRLERAGGGQDGLRVTPVTAGARGRWIKTGVTWSQLHRGYSRVFVFLTRPERAVRSSDTHTAASGADAAAGDRLTPDTSILCT